MEEERALAEKKMEEERALAEKKMEEERALAEKKMEEKRIIVDKQLDMKILMQEKELEFKERIADKKLALENQKRLDYNAQKSADRVHCTIENNKNRRMSALSRHPYLEMDYYGNAGSQYQTAQSTKMNIFTKLAIHESISQKDDNKVSKIINKIVDKKAALLPIVAPSGNLIDEYLVDANEHVISILQVLDELKKAEIVESEISHNWVDEVKEQVSIVSSVQKRDHVNMMIPDYIDMLTDINKNKLQELPKQKNGYVKPKNHARVNRVDGEMYIRCYVCSSECKMSSSGVHRSHNLPKSRNGSWSKNNIYLCCATCNQDMNNTNTIEEYTCTMMDDRLSGVSISFKECIDVGYTSDTDTYDSDAEEDAPTTDI
jgi:5-methylcytosine-specific restriction endonuclease McrA